MDLEQSVAQFNQNVFFREFSFSQTKFKPAAQDELELADHIVWLDDLLLTFQLKQRTMGDTDALAEEKWFRSKVLNKAKKQVKDTHHYLSCHAPIQVTNERGHSFGLEASRIRHRHDVILYESHPLLPTSCRETKSVVSSEIGLIHVLHVDDYQRIAQVLITPAEIADYLEYRCDILTRAPQIHGLPEEAFLGHFLYGDKNSLPKSESVRYVRNLTQELGAFDLSPVLHQFAERIVSGTSWGLPSTTSTDYYRVVQELARLNRSELKMVKERIDLALEWCRADRFEIPTRFVSPRTGCGFVFVVVPTEAKSRLGQGLQNYTYAHKYDQRLRKCLGMAVSKDGEFRDVGWCYIEEEWSHDPQMETMLAENFPFRDVREERIATYHFNAQA